MTTAEMMTNLRVMLLVQVLLQLAGGCAVWVEQVHVGPTESVGRGNVWGGGRGVFTAMGQGL